MAALIQLIENNQLDWTHTREFYQRLITVTGGMDKIFLLCEGELANYPANNYQEFPDLAIETFYLPTNTDLASLEGRITEILAQLAQSVSGDIYFAIEPEHNPLAALILIKLMEGFPDKLHFLQLSQLNQETAIYDFAAENDRPINQRLFFSYVESCNYSAIAVLIRQHKVPQKLGYQVQQLIKFRNFSFNDEVRRLITSYQQKLDLYPTLRIYRQPLAEMLQLAYGKQVPFIKALYFNCRLEYEQSDFVDFLVRFLRLLEELLIYVLGWDEDQTGKLVYRSGDHPGKPVSLPHKELSCLRDVFNQLPQLCHKYAQFYQYINSAQVQALVDQKHLSIGGHGYHGVSKEVLSKLYPGDILGELYAVIESLGIKLTDDYYDVLNAFLLAEYNRYLAME